MKRVRTQELRIPPPSEDSVVIRWQKVGGGSLYFKNHIIKPNEKFWAAKESLPKAFMDTLIPLTKLPEEEVVVEQKVEAGYKLSPKGRGWFDIVDEKTGKKLNEKSMRLDEATEYLESL